MPSLLRAAAIHGDSRPVSDMCVSLCSQGVLNLKLTKQTPGTWETLLLENATKEELQQRRASAIEVGHPCLAPRS